jgi:hypothetical protein
MSFLENIKGFNFSDRLLEQASPNFDKDVESIVKRLNDEVGGEEDEAIIDSILDDIDYRIIDDNDDEKIKEMLMIFSDPNKIEYFKKYKDLKKDNINSLSKDILKVATKIYSDDDKTRTDANNSFNKYANGLNLELDRINKLIQIYENSLKKGVDEKSKNKTNQIVDSKESIQKAVDAYRKASSDIINALDKKAESDESNDVIIDQVADTLGKSGVSIININIGGKEVPVEQKIKEIKEKEEAKKPKDTVEQRDFIKKTISKLRDSNIPDYKDGKIVRKGGFFENIQHILSSYREVLLNLIERNKIELGQSNQFLNQENPDVKYQLSYLDATRAFLDYMVETYITYKRDADKIKKVIDSLYLEKAGYIKNKNLSRKISMSDFAGLRIKREISIPLYKTVNIPITDEDIIANSKFTKFKNAIKSLAGIMGGQKSYVDQAKARASKNQNRAILQLINNVSKSIAGAVGGEKAKKSVGLAMKKTANALNLELEENLKEDMVAPIDSGSMQPGVSFDVPQSVPGGMDTFALLGPGGTGKKPKKKKKKSRKKSSAIISFDDFINNKK